MAGKRVLIIDDSENIRATLKLTLEFRGYEVEEACDGKAGLEMLEQNRYDMVFCDLAMPVMNGEEVIRKLRREMGNTELPVVVISAEERDAKNRALTLGATDFIDKPFYPEQIFEMAEKILGE